MQNCDMAATLGTELIFDYTTMQSAVIWSKSTGYFINKTTTSSFDNTLSLLFTSLRKLSLNKVHNNTLAISASFDKLSNTFLFFFLIMWTGHSNSG